MDELINDVGQSDKLAAPTRTTIVTFLGDHRALLERLGAEVTQQFFEALYLQGAPTAWEVLVAKLGPDEVLTLLKQTRVEMKQATAQRAQTIAQFHAFAEELGVAALRVLTQMIL